MGRREWLIAGCLLAVPAMVVGCECSIRGGHDAAHRTWDAEVEKCFSKEMIGRSFKEATIFGKRLGEERMNEDMPFDYFEEILGDSAKPIVRSPGVFFDHPFCDRFPDSCFDEGLVFGLNSQDRIVWIGRWVH